MWRVVALAWLLVGCAQTLAPPAAEPRSERVTVERVEACNERTLRSFAPSVGDLRVLRPRRVTVTTERVIERELVDCADLSPGHCTSWIEERAGERHAAGEVLRISPVSRRLGTLVTLRVDGRIERELFARGEDLVHRVRTLEAEGREVSMVSEKPEVERDTSSVLAIRYDREPMRIELAAADVQYELPRGRRAAWEALWTLSDELEEAGLELTETSATRLRVALLERLEPDAPVASLRSVPSPLAEPGARALSLSLVVRCQTPGL